MIGWHRDYARAALREALVIKLVRPRRPRPRVYGDELLPALVRCWVLLRAPAGKILAPFMPVLVPLLRAEGEITVTDTVLDELLAQISAATIDRMLAGSSRPSQRPSPPNAPTQHRLNRRKHMRQLALPWQDQEQAA